MTDIADGQSRHSLRTRNAAWLAAQAEAAAAGAKFERIEEIDISPLFGDDADAIEATATAIREASATLGFFYVSGHGIDEELISSTFAGSKRFFDLPVERKLEVSILNHEKMRGYTGLLDENTDPDNDGDLHEAFDLAQDFGADSLEVAADIYGWATNQWPTLDGFRDQILAYYEAIVGLASVLYRGFALSLGLDEAFFEPMLDRPVGELRLLKYPPQPTTGHEADAKKVLGIGAHSDYDVFTILATDDVPALEIMSPTGDWIAAPPVNGSFLVNCGDLLQRWTNDLYRSAMHRVINNNDRDRYALVLFSNVNPYTIVEVLPTCESDTRPARYEPVQAASYVEALMRDAYGVSD